MIGWISLHRKIQDHWLFPTNRPFTEFEAWIDILMEVNHDEKKCNIGNQLYHIKVGESLKSLDTWSKRWSWNKSKTRRFFTLLQKDKMIEIKNEIKTTRLTVCNYGSYQSNGNANETQVKRKRNADETHLTPNNNINNYNNLNKDKATIFLKWISYRNEIKKSYKSEKSIENLINKFNEEPLEKVNIVVNSSIENQWQGLFWDKYKHIQNNGDKPMEIMVDGYMRRVAFYRENGNPVFEGTSKPTLEEVKSWK